MFEQYQSLINKNKSFLEDYWNLENTARPAFMIGYVGPKVKGGEPVKSALFATDADTTVKERLLEPQVYLDAQLDEINQQIQLGGDFVPALCPSLGVVSIASAFGCEVQWWDNDFPAARPLLDDPDKIPELTLPNINDGVLGRILDYTKFFIEKTNGKVPIRLTDIQGPLDTANLIVGHNTLMTAMITHPDEVHHLMKLVTEMTIKFAKAQRQICYDNNVEFVPAMFQPWIPDGYGISISNDDSIMISNEMHEEFHIPYVNQMSEEFGGIVIHSCGNWGHQFESLSNVHNLRGLEFGASEAPYKEVFDYFGDKIALACRVGFNRENSFHSMKEYVERIMQAKKTFKGLFINVDITNGMTGDNWPETDLDEIYSLIGFSKNG